MKKTCTALIAALLLVPLVAPAQAAGKSPRRGSFVARGIPYADITYSSPTASTYYQCLDGVEGVHKTTLDYVAPAAGTFTAEMGGFTGDWDLLLLDAEGEVFGWNYRMQWIDHKGHERVTMRLRPKQKIQVVACNWASAQTEVKVTYRLTSPDDYSDGRSAPLTHLDPGERPDLHERVPVNFVFVGFDESDVDSRSFVDALPERYRPLVRGPYYGRGSTEYLGIDYSYDFDLTFTDKSYEDRLFGYLKGISRRSAPTPYQIAYNDQLKNRLEIKHNDLIDAPSTERWLALNPPPGVDTRENTLYFLNWFGRDDFRPHVYTKLDEPDPDTGFVNGRYPSQMISGWGGTAPDDEESGYGQLRRVWFYDLSAGPERVAGNYIVDREDLDGNGRVDYRIPVSWEYHKKGFRKPSELTGDLAKIARYVGVNLLFTPSPIYQPALTPPDLPQTINLDVNTYEGSPGRDGSKEWVAPKEIRDKVAELLPLQTFTVDQQDLPVSDPQFLRCHTAWMNLYWGPSCYQDRPYSVWGDLFVHHALRAETWQDRKGADYEAGAFNFFIEGSWAGWGYADSNWWDETQSVVYVAWIADYAKYGGVSDIVIHEYGHHFGASHPHDGFDYEEKVDYGFWTDKFRFSYIGTEVNSIMNYLSVNNEFSQFDRDNMNRWQTAAYIQAANDVAAEVVESEGPRVLNELATADRLIAEAESAFSGHSYLQAATIAQRAYQHVRSVARSHGVKIKGSKSGLTVRPPGADPEDPESEDGHQNHHHPGSVDLLSERPIYDELRRVLSPVPTLPRWLQRS